MVKVWGMALTPNILAMGPPKEASRYY